jgi:hypothetical protein
VLPEMTTLAASKAQSPGIPRLDGGIGYSFTVGRPLALAVSALHFLDLISLIDSSRRPILWCKPSASHKLYKPSAATKYAFDDIFK